MKIKKELKKDTKLIIVIVVLLTFLTLSLSYSAIFSVKSVSTIQTIEAGTLSIVIDNTSTPIYEDLLPTPTSSLPTAADSSVSGNYATLNFTNNGTIKTEFALTISRDLDALPSLSTDSDLLGLNYLNIGVFDGTNWINFGTSESPSYYIPISSLTLVDGSTDSYIVLTDILDASASKTYQVYVWLAETTPTDEIGKLVYLKLDVDYATVKEETMTADEIALLNVN